MDLSYYEPFDKSHFTESEKKQKRKKFKRIPKDIEKSEQYKAKTPHPNYSKFGTPSYVDMKGRLYKIADRKFIEKIFENDSLIYPVPKDLPLQGKEFWGTQILFVKIPKKAKGVNFPEPGVDSLQLIHIDTQVIAKCLVEKAYYYPRAKTGHLVVKHFTSLGQSPDPSLYKGLL